MGNEHGKTYGDDDFSNHNAGSLRRAQKGEYLPGVSPQSKNIGQCRDKRDQVSSPNQTKPYVFNEALLIRGRAARLQADEAAQANDCQTKCKSSALDKANRWASVQTKDARVDPQDENKKTEYGNENTDAYPYFR